MTTIHSSHPLKIKGLSLDILPVWYHVPHTQRVELYLTQVYVIYLIYLTIFTIFKTI